MVDAHILGYPRIGSYRELKSALETYWRGRLDVSDLQGYGTQLRMGHWAVQRDAGLDVVTVGDFAWYDHVHNVTCLVGAAPQRFGLTGPIGLESYLAMARGTSDQPALAMKKWFNTNYHYLVPEVGEHTQFQINARWLMPEIHEAVRGGLPVKATLVGPLTWLWLAAAERGFDKLSLLPSLVSIYADLARALKSVGVKSLQLDEPLLVQDVPASWLSALDSAYRAIASDAPPILLATYFGSVADHAAQLKLLPIESLHLDLVSAPEQLSPFLADWPADKRLSLGVVDGRNIWRTNVQSALATLQRAHRALGERLSVSASCSLLHVPTDARLETKLDPEVRESLAFAAQKCEEIALLKRVLVDGGKERRAALDAALFAHTKRMASPALRNEAVRQRAEAIENTSGERKSSVQTRAAVQRQALELPLLPTTTIGSFPQTLEIRQARAEHNHGDLSDERYKTAMQNAIRDAVARQEALDLDVLVHGEPERSDMVEYFGEQLDGVHVTEHGWVQSYGSRCVKPPIIHGDVSRPRAMTVEWARFAQGLTSRPMKAMLTGPVTMLLWSFVRDDLPPSEVALQLALALRDEVGDLEAAGLPIIQIDEPALREGLPLKHADWQGYLDWAVGAFRLCAAGVKDETQIHTHMCYSQFSDILPAIAAMDADVITIEISHGRMELLDAFAHAQYSGAIGPGVYDTHSPRVPSGEEMRAQIERALQVLPAEQLWINPDCGLKARHWKETEAALAQMVSTAKAMRAQLRASDGTPRAASA